MKLKKRYMLAIQVCSMLYVMELATYVAICHNMNMATSWCTLFNHSVLFSIYVAMNNSKFMWSACILTIYFNTSLELLK